MRTLLAVLLLLTLLVGGTLLWLRGPLAETRSAALKAWPVYAMVRTAEETRVRNPGMGLVHRDQLAGPRDRWVTTPNNDTLYSSAFVDLSGGPVELTLPALPDRYHSVAVMDARTDNVVLLGTRDTASPGTVRLQFADGQTGLAPLRDGGLPVYRVPTRQAWILVRVLVDGQDDLPAAREAQQDFVLRGMGQPGPIRAEPLLLPAVPDPATLLQHANPVIAANPHLQAAGLAATGYGGGADAFEALPAWRQWLWRIVLPRMFERLRAAIADGARATGDGWSKTPPGIGTADAPDEVRAAVALAGLGALPKDEAVYWSAVLDAQGADLQGGARYRLTIPANVPARAFWSLSLYERLPDGRLFYVDNSRRRYAIGNRTPGLLPNTDGSLSVVLASLDPGGQANWLPAPRAGPFTLIFRAYLPREPIVSGAWRLPAIERLN